MTAIIRGVSLDARQIRTQSALTQAILELASERPVREISMADLARAAGVNRSTVYQHATSPAGLLCDVMRAELDAVREAHLVELGDLGQAMRETVLGVLDHLERHASIYRRELRDPANQLHAMLSGHFAASVAALIERLDLGPAGVNAALFREAAPRWIADGSVGAMAAWLDGPEPRDREAYLKIHAALLPPWWPTPV